MIATQYAPLARRTLKELPREEHFVHMALGLTGEMGEFIDAIKKFVIYGKGIDPSGAKNPDGSPVVMLVKDGGVLDTTNLTEETGDDFWYAANLLPELGVPAEVLQRAIDGGYTEGTRYRLDSTVNNGPFALAKALLSANLAVAAVSDKIANNPEMFTVSGSKSTAVVESLGGVLGSLCGLFNLDPTQAMDLNIKKLAKRYGDKFSDVAALNRDLAAERQVLEGK